MSVINTPDLEDINNPSPVKNKAIITPAAASTASVLVVIVTGGTKASDPNIAHLKTAFSDPYFDVQTLTVDVPSDITTTDTIENYTMEKALTFAAEGPYTPIVIPPFPLKKWTNLPVIIIKDTGVTNIDPSGMVGRIGTALQVDSSIGLCFLCKWNDACEKLQDVPAGDYVNGGSSLKLSKQPTATQAIMYRTNTRDLVRKDLLSLKTNMGIYLNSLISKGTVSATVFVPNIVDFDINLAITNGDFNKLNECAPMDVPPPPPQNMSYAVFWFILILILVFLVGWVLIQLGPR